MSNSFLQTSIEFLRGVGPKRGEILKQELRIFTYESLLNYFPFRYIDKSKFAKIKELFEDSTSVQIRGKVEKVKEVGVKQSKRLVVTFRDESGVMELIWFKGIKWGKTKINNWERINYFWKTY